MTNMMATESIRSVALASATGPFGLSTAQSQPPRSRAASMAQSAELASEIEPATSSPSSRRTAHLQSHCTPVCQACQHKASPRSTIAAAAAAQEPLAGKDRGFSHICPLSKSQPLAIGAVIEAHWPTPRFTNKSRRGGCGTPGRAFCSSGLGDFGNGASAAAVRLKPSLRTPALRIMAPPARLTPRRGFQKAAIHANSFKSPNNPD